jgi:ABC-2 type transport system ATP-binding protein
MATIEEFCSDLTILNRGNVVLQGNLNEIKKSYGRVNLVIKADADISSFISEMKLNVVEKTPSETKIRLEAEEQAKGLLNKLVEAGVPIVKFELTEPSLHEIFVEKVGKESNE